ncbi:hypothetical protein Tco_0374927 [Tanacetum coccineum]
MKQIWILVSVAILLLSVLGTFKITLLISRQSLVKNKGIKGFGRLPPEGAIIKCTRTTSGLAWDAQVRETAWTVDPFLRVAMNSCSVGTNREI